MHEGFNRYTHDFLLRRQDMLVHEGICPDSDGEMTMMFPIEPEFRALEYKAGRAFRENPVTHELEEVPDEDRYCFYVAPDSATLKEIGSAMHNCVS